MTAGQFTPITRPRRTTAKSRPIDPSGPRGEVHQLAPPRSADRTRGVGGPTLDPAVRRRNEVALDLVIDAVTTALTSVDVLERHARDVAEGFRQSDVRPARQGLTELVQTTQTMLRLAMVAAECSDLQIAALCQQDGATADEDMRDAVDHVIACQMACEWTSLAAVIEREFIPALGQWRAVFQRIASTIDPGPEGEAA